MNAWTGIILEIKGLNLTLFTLPISSLTIWTHAISSQSFQAVFHPGTNLGPTKPNHIESTTYCLINLTITVWHFIGADDKLWALFEFHQQEICARLTNGANFSSTESIFHLVAAIIKKIVYAKKNSRRRHRLFIFLLQIVFSFHFFTLKSVFEAINTFLHPSSFFLPDFNGRKKINCGFLNLVYSSVNHILMLVLVL